MCHYEVGRCFSCNIYARQVLKECDLRDHFGRRCLLSFPVTHDGDVIQDDVKGGYIWPFITIATDNGPVTTSSLHAVDEVIELCGECHQRCQKNDNGQCGGKAGCISGGREVLAGYVYSLSFEPGKIPWTDKGPYLDVKPARKLKGCLKRAKPSTELTLLLDEKMTKKERNNTYKVVTGLAVDWLETADYRRRDAFGKGVPFPFRTLARTQSAPSLAVPVNGPSLNDMQASAGSLSSSASSAAPTKEGPVGDGPFFVSPGRSKLPDGYQIPVPGAQAGDNAGFSFTPRSSIESLPTQESGNGTGTAGMGTGADGLGKGKGKRKRGSESPVEDSGSVKSARKDEQGGLQTYSSPGIAQPVKTTATQWAVNNTIGTLAAWNHTPATMLLNSAETAAWSSGATTTFLNNGAGSYPSGSVAPAYAPTSQASATAFLDLELELSEFLNFKDDAEDTDTRNAGAQATVEDSGISTQAQQESTSASTYPDPDASAENVVASAGPSTGTFTNPGAEQLINSTGAAFDRAWQGNDDAFDTSFDENVGNGPPLACDPLAVPSYGALRNPDTTGAGAGAGVVSPFPELDASVLNFDFDFDLFED